MHVSPSKKQKKRKKTSCVFCTTGTSSPYIQKEAIIKRYVVLNEGCSFHGPCMWSRRFIFQQKDQGWDHLAWLLSTATHLWSSASPTKEHTGNLNRGTNIPQNLNIFCQDNPPVLPALRFVSCISELQLLTDSTSSSVWGDEEFNVYIFHATKYCTFD